MNKMKYLSFIYVFTENGSPELPNLLLNNT